MPALPVRGRELNELAAVADRVRKADAGIYVFFIGSHGQVLADVYRGTPSEVRSVALALSELSFLTHPSRVGSHTKRCDRHCSRVGCT